MPVWSPKAIDYSQGFQITDSKTKQVYSHEEANTLPQEIKTRLVLKPNKIGCYVMTTQEAIQCVKDRLAK